MVCWLIDSFGRLIHWLTGCLFNWLYDWLVGWLIDWLIGWLIVWLISCLIDWLIGRLVGWWIDWFVGRLIDWLIDWWVDWLFDWLISWLIGWLTGWLVVWLIDFWSIGWWLVGWFVDWFLVDWMMVGWLVCWLIDWLIQRNLISLIDWSINLGMRFTERAPGPPDVRPHRTGRKPDTAGLLSHGRLHYIHYQYDSGKLQCKSNVKVYLSPSLIVQKLKTIHSCDKCFPGYLE